MISTVLKKHTLLALLGLIAAVCPAAQVWGDTWEQTTWSNAIYYRTIFDAPEAGDAFLRIAAVDSFVVYFNGETVSSDSSAGGPQDLDANAVHTQTLMVPVVRNDNHIAVLVINRGRGQGNGLRATLDMASVTGDTFRVQTTTDHTRQPWYWNAQPQLDETWTTANIARDETWHLAQEGSLESILFNGQAISGFPGGTDIGTLAGGITLKEVRGENLALNRTSNRPEVLDGDLNTSWNPPINSLNFNADIDLRVRRKIEAVRVLTRGRTPEQYADSSLRGYSIQVSDDQIRWTEVAVLRDIDEFVRTEARFPPVWARHVRLVVVDINAITQPRIAEIEVYGSLHAKEGTFTSEPLDLGAPNTVKNFGRVRWQAIIPDATELTVQFRSADQATDLADPQLGWSAPFATGDIWFPAAEPGTLVQYRINMATTTLEQTPVFEHLTIDFETGQVPVSSARGRISPNRVAMGQDTSFSYTLDLQFAPDDVGLTQIHIDVPAAAVLEEIDGLGAIALETWNSTQNQLSITLSEPLRQDTQLQIRFSNRTYSTVHSFRAHLFAPNSENPLNATQNTDLDPEAGTPYSWLLSAATSEPKTLSQVRATPAIFTPNSDGVNDFTTIEFILSKIDTPRDINIRLFDLSGHLIRNLNPPPLLAGSYQTARTAPGFWDGRDTTGSLVPPGLYLYQVKVEVDSGDETATGLIGVVY